MSFEKIFNTSTILQHINVKIDGFDVVKEDIISIEIKQDFSVFGIVGSIKIKNTFDMANNGNVKFNNDNLIVISSADFRKTKNIRTYRILDINVESSDGRVEIYDIKFIDEITFILSNTYISKGFKVSPVVAFNEFVTELGIDKIDDMIIETVDTSTVANFVVPQNVSVLQFFIDKFREDNIHIWQDRFGIYVKEVTPSTMSTLKIDNKEVLYTNKTINNEYLFKIHEIHEKKNATSNLLPVNRSFRFNNDKIITDKTLNVKDDISKIEIVKSNANIQLTTGEKYVANELFTTGDQTYDLFDVFIKNNTINIVVKGDYESGNIFTVVNTFIKGNIVSADSSLKGDASTSGKYFVGAVSDRIIGDKMIQKLSLHRI